MNLSGHDCAPEIDVTHELERQEHLKAQAEPALLGDAVGIVRH
ncbi:MAG: hypothetical protein JWM91_597 [Rhodospirillales bacterium]|nr:hypothetical protein [Rhodospirillales bacterium]